MSPVWAIHESREAEDEGAADKRDVVPLLGVAFDSAHNHEGQGGSPGDLGEELIADRDMVGLEPRRRDFGSLGCSNTRCGP